MTTKDAKVLAYIAVLIISFILIICMPNSAYFNEHLILFVLLTKVVPMGLVLWCAKQLNNL